MPLGLLQMAVDIAKVRGMPATSYLKVVDLIASGKVELGVGSHV